MRPPQIIAALAACLSGFATGVAQDAPGFVLQAIDGRKATGVLTVAQDGTARVTPAQGEVLSLSLADILSVEAVEPPPAAGAAPMYVWLRSGTRFPATKLDGAAAAAGKPAVVRCTIPSGATLDVPLSMIAALRCREVEPKTFAQDREAPELNQDFLYVVKEGKPQRFSVSIESLHDGKVHFELGGESYDFALAGEDSTAAVVFGKNTGFAPDRQGKPRIALALKEGEVLEGRLLEFGPKVRIKIDEGAEVEVAATAVRRLDVVSDKLTWLTKLTPKVEQTPAFDRVWPWTADRSPMGPGIQLGGKTYARGLVLVPKTRLTFDLGGKYDVFEATIGIDERGGPQAHAIFRVLVDGKVAFDSGPVQRDSQTQVVRVELAKCQSLAIEADFGKNFDLGDLCAFADARLVQK